jgi:hypothetical protein
MSDDKLKEKNVGLELIPSREEAIANITKIEPEYQQYLSKLPDSKRQRIVNSISSIRHGLHAIAPMMCLGPEKCPIIERCPIPERDSKGKIEIGALDNYPIGRECLLEKFYMQQKIIEYVEHLNVDPANPVEMSIVNELALIDLYKNRALMIMSTGDKSGQGRDFMRIDVLGFNESGETAESAKLHPAVEMMDRLEKRREKWLDKLMETRKAKAEWAIRVGGAQNESKILAEISKLREAIATLESEPMLSLEEHDEDADDEILLGD